MGRWATRPRSSTESKESIQGCFDNIQKSDSVEPSVMIIAWNMKSFISLVRVRSRGWTDVREQITKRRTKNDRRTH